MKMSMKEKKYKYKYSDFIIEKEVTRHYSNGFDHLTLILAKVTNKITGKVMNDWVRPIQLRSTKSLNELIKWD